MAQSSKFSILNHWVEFRLICKWFISLDLHPETRHCLDGTEGVQNEPPQNMHFWLVDYFELKSIKA